MILLFYFYVSIPEALTCKLISALLYVAWEPLSDLKDNGVKAEKVHFVKNQTGKSSWEVPMAGSCSSGTFTRASVLGAQVLWDTR